MPTYRCSAPPDHPSATITAESDHHAADLYRQAFPTAKELGIAVQEISPGDMSMEHMNEKNRLQYLAHVLLLVAAGAAIGVTLPFAFFHLFTEAQRGEVALVFILAGLAGATYFAGRNLRAQAREALKRITGGLLVIDHQVQAHSRALNFLQSNTLAVTDRDRALIGLARLRRKLHTLARELTGHGVSLTDWIGIDAALEACRGALGRLPDGYGELGSDQLEAHYQATTPRNPPQWSPEELEALRRAGGPGRDAERRKYRGGQAQTTPGHYPPPQNADERLRHAMGDDFEPLPLEKVVDYDPKLAALAGQVDRA